MANQLANGVAKSNDLIDQSPLSLRPADSMRLVIQGRAGCEDWAHIHPEGLKIIIVGGGIGGLTAATALRQQGHIVEIYESSSFSKEVGAALHTAPNANAALKGLGISCKDIGANVAEWMSEWSFAGEQIKKVDLVAHGKVHEHKWRLAHRVKLHDALRRAAVGHAGIGRPAKLHLSKAVTNIDTANAIVYFKDGTSVQGDLVIGADGVHSVARKSLPGGTIQPFRSGHSAFRFLISKETVLLDPRTQKFAEHDGNLHGIFGPDRSIIIYPTCDNTVLNFVCIHPETESASTESWGNTASLSKLLEVYKDFHPDMLALLEKADESSLKVWKLLDMDPLPSWCHGRLAVIGDAAHPFLPFLGQGAAIAIEDAIAIGILLETGISKNEIPERLRLYETIRKERAELIQYYTRMSGKSRGVNSSFNVAQYQGYCFGYNEWHNAAQRLREWKWNRLTKHSHLMTSVFGPVSSFQQPHRSQLTPTIDPTFLIATIKFHTSRTILDGLLPPGNRSFKFKSSGSVAQCTFRQVSFRGLPSLGGRGYNQLGLYIHGIEYKGLDGQTVSGAFLPIMFENMADTIIAGREEIGIPKVWSTIDIERDRRSYHVRTSWEGLTWGNFYLDGLELVKPTNDEPFKTIVQDSSQLDEGTILHRYISQLDSGSEEGRPQSERTVFIRRTKDASCSHRHAVNVSGVDFDCFSNGAIEPRSTLHRVWTASSAHLNLNARDWDAFPTLHHIISRLAELPMLGVIEATLVEGSGIPDLV